MLFDGLPRPVQAIAYALAAIFLAPIGAAAAFGLGLTILSLLHPGLFQP